MEYSPFPVFGLGAATWKFGGDSNEQRQTTEVQLTPEQKKLQGLALPYLESFAGAPPELPDFSLIAGFDPLQTQGQEAALAAAQGPQQQVADIGAQMAGFLSGDVLRPESNPALQGAIDASVAPIYEGLTQSVLPNIRGEASTVGQFGGSRQGIAEGLASQGASRAAGETASRVANTNYQAGLDALTRNLALLPQTSALQLTPALTTSGVGDVRQALAQALLGEEGQRFQFDQIAPLLVGKELAGISAGLPGGSVTTTASTPQADPLMQALGLGATALGTFLGGPAGGALGGSLAGTIAPTGSPFAGAGVTNPNLPWL